MLKLILGGALAYFIFGQLSNESVKPKKRKKSKLSKPKKK